MAEAQIRPDPFPVDNVMIRAFLAREYDLDEETAGREYPDNIINVVMCGDSHTYETWRRGAKRQQYGI